MVTAISPSAAAAAVVLVTWEAVQSSAKAVRLWERSGRNASAARNATVSSADAKNQLRRRPNTSMRGAQQTLRACGSMVVPPSTPICASDTPSWRSQYGAVIEA